MMAMSKELFRLATYGSWPNNAEMRPFSLARAGFFSVGNGDEVECFQCKVRLKGWTEGHDAVTRHRQASPHCPLLNETCRDNVSLDSYISISNNNINSRSQTESDNAGFISEVVSRSDGRLSGVSLLYKQALSRAQKSGLFLNRTVSNIDRNNPDFRVLLDERERLRTFYDWPSNANVRAVDLAREGFFYKGTADRVQCVYCRGFIRDWEPTDVPRTEHRRHFPNCPSFRGIELHNDRLTRERNAVDRINHSTAQQPSVVISSHANESIPRAPAQLVSGDGAGPKFPEYSEYSVRVESFRGRVIAAGQTAEGLADAGWFYVGPNDKVRCFQCGGNLRDWEPNDNPWTEHNRWYEHCQYVKTHRPTERSRVPENPIPAMNTDVVSRDAEPREVKAQLDTPTVQAVLSMGYSRDRVKAVIESRLLTTGEDFPNAESLLEALFQLEETETASGAAVSSLNSNGRISLKAESAVLSPIPEANQTKTKAAKKKKNKKKKAATVVEPREEPREEEPSIVEKPLLEEPRLEETQDEDAVRYLEEENRVMREQRTCKVCMDADVNTVFLPCGHLVCCATCSPQLRNCPMCRTFIRGTVKTFLS